MHCIFTLNATCVDYIVEYNSKPDSMLATHEKTTKSVHFTGTYEFLANVQSRTRTVIHSSRVNKTLLVSVLHECITCVED